MLQVLPLYAISMIFFFSQTEAEKIKGKKKKNRREQGKVINQKGKKPQQNPSIFQKSDLLTHKNVGGITEISPRNFFF